MDLQLTDKFGGGWVPEYSRKDIKKPVVVEHFGLGPMKALTVGTVGDDDGMLSTGAAQIRSDPDEQARVRNNREASVWKVVAHNQGSISDAPVALRLSAKRSDQKISYEGTRKKLKSLAHAICNNFDAAQCAISLDVNNTLHY